jgi:hypothetical protein
VEEPAGAGETWTTEQAEELLGAMAEQKKAKDEPQYEQTCVHNDPYTRRRQSVIHHNIVDGSNISPCPCEVRAPILDWRLRQSLVGSGTAQAGDVRFLESPDF